MKSEEAPTLKSEVGLYRCAVMSCGTLVVAILLSLATSLWAAGGWYLLIPPRGEYNESAPFLQGYKILDNKPLSQWGQQGAYDSALECEAAKNSLLMVQQNIYSNSYDAYIKAIGAGTDPAVLQMLRSVAEANSASVLAFMFSRCIGSDDPRLR